MVRITKGDIFFSGCDAIVNTVNCTGIMGAGLARIFADKFPTMELDYIDHCRRKTLSPGIMHWFKEGDVWVVNFPTVDKLNKKVTKRESYSYVRLGLRKLREDIWEKNSKSIAIPALGCGIVGLDWNKVLPIIINDFMNDERMKFVEVLILWPRDDKKEAQKRERNKQQEEFPY